MKTSQALLMFLLTLASTYVQSLPINSVSAVSEEKELQENVRERTISFNPNAETGKSKPVYLREQFVILTICMHIDFTIKVGDVTYFTKNYQDLLTEQYESEQSSHGKQKRVATLNQWIWPHCVIPYVIHESYTGKLMHAIIYHATCQILYS